MNKNMKKLILAIVAVCGLAVGAQAQSVTYTSGFPTTVASGSVTAFTNMTVAVPSGAKAIGVFWRFTPSAATNSATLYLHLAQSADGANFATSNATNGLLTASRTIDIPSGANTAYFKVSASDIAGANYIRLTSVTASTGVTLTNTSVVFNYEK